MPLIDAKFMSKVQFGLPSILVFFQVRIKGKITKTMSDNFFGYHSIKLFCIFI